LPHPKSDTTFHVVGSHTTENSITSTLDYVTYGAAHHVGAHSRTTSRPMSVDRHANVRV
jgi:hypothetical protein